MKHRTQASFSHIPHVWRLETGRYITRKYLGILLLTAILAIGVVSIAINAYHHQIERTQHFTADEINNFKTARNYDHYSQRGVNILFVPSPTVIFFPMPADYYHLTFRINSVADLEVSSNGNKDLPSEAAFPFPLSFSLVIFFLFTFYALYLGYDASSKPDYIAFLQSYLKASVPGTFWLMIAVRFVLLTGAFLFIFLIAVGYAAIRGIIFSAGDYSVFGGYAFNTLLLFLICLFIGSLFGKIQKKISALTALLLIWIGLVVVIPFTARGITQALITPVPSSSQAHNQKKQIITNFEIRVATNIAKYNRANVDLNKQIINDYLNNEAKQVEAVDTRIRELIARNVEIHNIIFALTPFTANLQISQTAGSCSKENYIKFFIYAQIMKFKYLHFIIDRTYYNNPKILVNFIKGTENQYHVNGHQNEYYGLCTRMTLIFILVISIIATRSIKNRVFPIGKGEIPNLGTYNPKDPGEEPELKMHRFSVWFSETDKLKKFLFHLLHGDLNAESLKEIKWKITLGETDLLSRELQGDFLYICHPDDIPEELQVKTFIHFFCTTANIPETQETAILNSEPIQTIADQPFGNLTARQKQETMITILPLTQRKTYLINDLNRKLTDSHAIKVQDAIDELLKSNATVLLLTSEVVPKPDPKIRLPKDSDFVYNELWHCREAETRLNMRLNGMYNGPEKAYQPYPFEVTSNE